jgi:hypothetical protein
MRYRISAISRCAIGHALPANRQNADWQLASRKSQTGYAGTPKAKPRDAEQRN